MNSETQKNHSSINTEEILKFNQYSINDDKDDHPLYKMNVVRVPFIIEGLVGPNNITDPNCLNGIKILDVGCGVGYLSRALAKYNAQVVGLDAAQDVIVVANNITNRYNELKNRITFIWSTIEEFSSENKEKFDVLILSEILEHVSNRHNFIKLCLSTLKNGGSIFITTLEKTYLTWLFGIVLFENVLNVVPRGLHDWNKFVPIQELKETFDRNKCSIVSVKGYWYNYWTKSYTFINSTNTMFYAMHVVKRL